MPAWTTFVGLTLVVLVALLVLARASQEYVPDDGGGRADGTSDRRPPDEGDSADRSGDPAGDDGSIPSPDRTTPGGPNGDVAAGAPEAGETDTWPPSSGSRSRSGAVSDADLTESPPREAGSVARDENGTGEGATVELRQPGRPGSTETVSAAEIPTGVLLANVTLSQATFGVVLLAGAWLARIPPAALGLPTRPGLLSGAVALGAVVGVVLYVLNAIGAGMASAGGVEYDETLRDLMTPSTVRGWVILLGVVLPVVAGFEEFLFRAALIGVPAAGLDLPAWPLAVVSSAAFAFGHGAQGRAGIAVTGLLGFGLAAVFVLTGSLVVVVVAHYLVNALEFVVGGYFGIDPFE